MNLEIPTLHHYFQQTTWRRLTAMMASLGLLTRRGQRKTDSIDQLYRHLSKQSLLGDSIPHLDADAQNGLAALVRSEGALPIHTFERRFGPIRDYKPWRKGQEHRSESPERPWLSPISATDRLWYLGLIYRHPHCLRAGQPQHFVLSKEIQTIYTLSCESTGPTT